MSFQIEMKVCGYPIYSVNGRRLTTNKNGVNDYEYQVIHTTPDFIMDRSTNRECTVGFLTQGEIKHQYNDGLIVLCEKILQKINKEMDEDCG